MSTNTDTLTYTAVQATMMALYDLIPDPVSVLVRGSYYPGGESTQPQAIDTMVRNPASNQDVFRLNEDWKVDPSWLFSEIISICWATDKGVIFLYLHDEGITFHHQYMASGGSQDGSYGAIGGLPEQTNMVLLRVLDEIGSAVDGWIKPVDLDYSHYTVFQWWNKN